MHKAYLSSVVVLPDFFLRGNALNYLISGAGSSVEVDGAVSSKQHWAHLPTPVPIMLQNGTFANAWGVAKRVGRWC